MVSRGVHQLKNVRLYFCDFGGSSNGVRDLMKSQELADFITKNQHLNLEVYLKRGHHPYMSSTYINGYVKDQPLRNLNQDEVLDHFQKFNNSVGRKALEHNSPKVSTTAKSIQGQWNAGIWNRFPQHQIEDQKDIPYTEIPKEVLELKPIKFKKVKRHALTNYLARKFPLPKYNVSS